MYFVYGQQETDYLKKKDKRLAAVIDAVGPIQRPVDPDLFSSVIHHIVGQQISSKALTTVWNRMQTALGRLTPEAILSLAPEELQSFGITFRKADYIRDFACRVQEGRFDLEGLWHKPDEEVIAALCSLRGIGVWTAEMILLFCMQRPDVFSFDDLALHRGLRMIYHHRTVDRALFEKYRRRYSPCGSVASLYLWAVAGGAVEGMRDYAPKKK